MSFEIEPVVAAITRRAFLAGAGSVFLGMLASCSGDSLAPKDSSLDSDLPDQTDIPQDPYVQSILKEALDKEFDLYGNVEVAKYTLPESGIDLTVVSDSSTLALKKEAVEPLFIAFFAAAAEAYETAFGLEAKKTVEDTATAIFKNRTLEGKALRLFISSNPETCMSLGGLRATDTRTGGSNTSCLAGDGAQFNGESMGFTRTFAEKPHSDGPLVNPVVGIRIAPNIYQGAVDTVRDDKILYTLRADQAVSAVLGHESMHALLRLSGYTSDDSGGEESIVQVAEEHFVRTRILDTQSTLVHPVTYGTN